MLRLFSAVFVVMFYCLVSWQSHANTEPTETLIASNITESQLSPWLKKLPDASLSVMPELINQIAEVDAPQVRDLLTYLMAGELYYVKANQKIVRAERNEDGLYQLTDLLSGELLTPVAKKTISKIKTNNSLRSDIRNLIAQLDLTHKNKDIRLTAVKQLLDNPEPDAIKTLAKLIKKEKHSDVRELMSVTLLVDQLLHGSVAEKIAAIEQLQNSLEPAVKNAMVNQLNQLRNTADTATNAALDEKTVNENKVLSSTLTKAIAKIESRKGIFEFIENLFFGLSLGSVLLLAAIGLTITFGVMGVINMAHGEMMMLGAYTTYVIQQAFPNLIEYSLLMAIPAAFMVSGFVGILIERGVIRHLKGRPLETLLATFGISLILQQLVRTIFSPLNRQVSAPEWMSGSWQINPVFSLTYNRLYIIIFSIMVFVALLLILKKTSLGLHVRAVSQNRDMARALSIKSNRVDAITFGLGSGIAGVAGVVLSQLTNVGPNLGQAYIIDSFLVVVFGGVGNLWGTLVAAMSLGSINKFLEPLTGSVLANIIVLVGLVLFIQKRPKGLFPQKGRSAD